MTTKYFSYGLTFICASLFVIGCSELKEEKVPTQTVVSVHGEGFANPTSTNFHGKFIQSKNYDLSLCQQCHGMNYAGGTANKSCNTCHNQQGGPENCMTCHGSVNAAPPKDLSGNSDPTSRSVGAHQKHLASNFGASVSCTECHHVPAKLTDAGHIDNSLHAEVTFDSTSQFFRAGVAYDAANVACSNTYCHGNFNGGNQTNSAVWTGTAQCGTCHGDPNETTPERIAFPKSGHPEIGSYTCVQCHNKVIDASLSIIDPSKHMNGRID